MSNMCTFMGHKFDPLFITSDDIIIEDIAHALSLLCRGGGHLRTFYSVGQHCINCAKEAEARGLSKRAQLSCLLHDASEAYISDIIRPVKEHLSNYLEIENSIMNQIWNCYGLGDLSEAEHAIWKQIDDDILWYELSHLIDGYGSVDCSALKTIPDTDFTAPTTIEKKYLDMFYLLIDKI